jgi:hypothetical protein
MELLGDMGHVESHFFPFGDNVSVGAVCAKHTNGSEIILDAMMVLLGSANLDAR